MQLWQATPNINIHFSDVASGISDKKEISSVNLEMPRLPLQIEFIPRDARMNLPQGGVANFKLNYYNFT